MSVYEELVELGLVYKVIVDGEVFYQLTQKGSEIADDIAFEEGYILAN